MSILNYADKILVADNVVLNIRVYNSDIVFADRLSVLTFEIVQRSENGVIIDPFFLTPENKVAEAEELMQRYRISGVPIVETLENRKLVGIITNRDMRFISNYDTPISEHMTSEKLVTAPVGTDLETAESILHEHRIEKLPLVDEEGRLSGLITIKDIDRKSVV